MFAIALTTSSCLRAGTRVDVIWAVDGHRLGSFDGADAVALTPGGGRFGSLLGGAISGHLADLAGRHSTPRLVGLDVTAVDAAVAGLPDGGSVTVVVAPADQLPSAVWAELAARRPICLVADLDGDTLGPFTLHTTDDIEAAGPAVAERFGRGDSGTSVETTPAGRRIVCIMCPVDRFVIAGNGPIADALAAAAGLHRWQVRRAGDVDTATGLMVDLTRDDMVVVMGHDVELSSRMLAAALASDAGYIGALGSARMQQQRADWLAYRGITDIDRVNGPAGLAIGADTPAEIAVSIIAQVIAVRNL